MNYTIIQAVRYLNLWLFFPMQPTNQLTITGVVLGYKKVGHPCSTAISDHVTVFQQPPQPLDLAPADDCSQKTRNSLEGAAYSISRSGIRD
jgi:hypothetical protein